MNTFRCAKRCRFQISSALFAATFLVITAEAAFSTAETRSGPRPQLLRSVNSKFGFADLVASEEPAVVCISILQNATPRHSSDPGGNNIFNDTFNQFYGPKTEQPLLRYPRPGHTFGSGFVIDPKGYIVTNNHVIGNATKLQITLTDGSSYPARIVGRDVMTDLALLKIDSVKPLPYVAFGNSDEERVGDWVVAVGNAYGLGDSAKAGIISGRNRDLDDGPYDDFLQTDAPINPGDSGGPLLNEMGQVIGIATAIYSPTDTSVGIGFGVPSNIVREIVKQLRKQGHVTRGWLGIRYQSVTPSLAKAVELQKPEGVLVTFVMKELPAATAGIQQGDVILSFNRKKVSNPRDLAFAVAAISPGQKVPLTVWRGEHKHALLVAMGAQDMKKITALDTEAQQRPLGDE